MRISDWSSDVCSSDLKVCASVAAVDDDVRRLMDDMLETMYAAPGIGLAAPQVGVLKRVIVIDTAGEDEKKTPLFLANPELIEVSDEIGRAACRERVSQYV